MSKVYEMLFDWQKPFIDRFMDKEKFGYFLDMGIGKTPISVCAASKRGADLIVAVTLTQKVQERYAAGSFAEWLAIDGYESWFIDELTTKSGMRRLEDLVASGVKLAIVMNHQAMASRASRTPKLDENGIPVLDRWGKTVYAESDSEIRVSILRWVFEHYNNISLIIDESHMLKERNSATSKAYYKLLYSQEQRKWGKRFKSVFLLTGTPMSLGYQDLYSQLRILGLKMSYKDYSNRYLILDHGVPWFDKPVIGYNNVPELMKMISEYGVFATKEAYFADILPETLTTVIPVERPPEYEMMGDPKSPTYKTLDGFTADTPATLMLRLRQLASGYMGNAESAEYYSLNKMNALVALLNRAPNNYIVFYTYEPELYLIQEAAKEAGYVYDTYNGWIQENKWYDDDTRASKKLWIANIQSGNAGLNKQKYNATIFFSLPNRWMYYSQAIHRTYRLGQNADTVFYYILKTNRTIEDRIYKRLLDGKDYDEDFFAQQMAIHGLIE